MPLRAPLLVRLLPALALLSIPASFGGPADAPAASTSAERFIIRFSDASLESRDAGARDRAFEAAARGSGAHLVVQHRLATGADVVTTDRALDGTAMQRLLQRLAATAHVDYVERDAVLRPLMTPNDPGYSSQWNQYEAASGIGLPRAWDHATGKGIVVAVIDTGIAPHTDLAANLLPGYDFVSDTARSGDGDGRDAHPDDPGDWAIAGQCGTGAPAANSTWHGTHVAGTIAARANNRKGIAGVAFDARVLPVRALGTCGGFTSDVADAIVWSSGGAVPGVPANKNPAEVINLSLGGVGSCDRTLQAAIDSAVAKGTTVVTGAGNAAGDAAQFAPAGCRNVVTVGAVGRSGARAAYSNGGSRVDVSAPGGDGADGLLSTTNTGLRSQTAEGYSRKQGTSEAAALVSGVVALMQSAAVNTPARVREILMQTARPLTKPCKLDCGAGIVDAAKAVSTAVTPTLSVGDVSIAEGDSGTKSLNFVVSLSGTSATPVTFKFATADGTATAGSDYVARALTGRTIAAGQLQTTVGVTINGDATVESDETVLLDISNAVGATISDGQGTGTITNDDSGAALPTLSVSDVITSEGASAVFVVHLSAPSATPVSFKFATADGSATVANNDYVPKALTGRTIPAGQTTSQIGVTVVEDTTTEPTETFALNISQPSGATIADGQGIASISNDDPGPTLRIYNVSQYEGDSGTTQFLFTAALDEVATGPVTFHVATSDGTATAGSDYVVLADTAKTIPQGSLSVQFTVDVIGDTVAENDETFNIVVSQLSGATENPLPGKVGTILDDEAPRLSIQADTRHVGEGNSGTATVEFAVGLNHAATVPVTFHYATTDGTATAASGDYVAKSANRTIAVGDTYTIISFQVNGDTALEPDETFFVDLSPVTGATIANGRGTALIANDDGPLLSITPAVSTIEGNSGTRLATFTLNLSAASPQDVVWNGYTRADTFAPHQATSGEDYVATSVNGGVIPVGQTSATFSVPINGDTTVEDNETYQAFVYAVTGAHGGGAGVGTIVNDEGPMLSIGDVTVTETNARSDAVFTITLSQPAATNVSFALSTGGGTASSSTDYSPTTGLFLSIPAGQTSKTYSVPIYGDGVAEPTETFLVTLSNSTGASIFDAQATCTILDND